MIRWRYKAVQPLLARALLLVSLAAVAQEPAPRLSRPIASSLPVPLAGSRSPRLRAAEDLGRVPAETAIPGITLVFRRSSAQEADLRQLLASQQDPASALYHHWLTPDSFASRFGIAASDIARTADWLQARGFQIDRISRSRDRITFSGSAAQVQAAFGAELHRFRAQGELHIAPASGLSLPADLASITSAVLHLSDFRPTPGVRSLPPVLPDYTTASTQVHFLGPKDIATMYDLKPLWQSGFYGGGQGLAILGQSYVDTSFTSKIASFQTALAQHTAITPVLVPSSGVEAISPGDEGESQIDLEYASGIAQNANLFLVYVGDSQNYNVFDALTFAITENIAPVLSISYSICETLMTAAELDQENALFEEAAAQGQTLIASSGDSGSTECADYGSSSGLTLAQRQAPAVGFPANSPWVTAVGGTQMASDAFTSGASPYWATASTFDTVGSLLSYVPELTWNESSAAFGLAAGGGGSSAYYPRPAWQSGVPGIPPGSYRLLPDIALQASIQSPGYIICVGDPTASSCTAGLRDSQNRLSIAGGTSFAAPIFAGFVAILNQYEHTTGQGNLNPVLYGLAAQPSVYASAFHDIASGSNACVNGIGICAAPANSSFAATAGYDQATGLGSLDFYKLALAWPSSSASPLMPTAVTITLSQASAAPGATVPVTILVAPTNDPGGVSAPGGTLTLSVDGKIVVPSMTLHQNNPASDQVSASYSLVAPPAAGSHLLTAAYSGDARHAASTSTASLLVGSVTATGGVALSASDLAVPNGSTGSTRIAITPTGGYSGRLTWSLAFTSGPGPLTACYRVGSVPVSTPTTATLTIGVGTACSAPLPTGNQAVPISGPHAALHPPAKQSEPRSAPAAALGGLLLCGLLFSRRRKVRLPLLSIAVLTLAVAGLGGCGGAHTSGTVTPPPVANTYTILLTGRDSVNTSIVGSTTFTLTVN